MSAMFTCRGCMDDHCRLSPRPFSTGLSSAELVNGAANRRSRIQDIETDIDRACEREALRHRWPVSAKREAWDQQTWRRYVAEAMRQIQLHASELGRLRREAVSFERLVQALDCRSAAPSAARSPGRQVAPSCAHAFPP
jgi:hypothetical protein